MGGVQCVEVWESRLDKTVAVENPIFKFSKLFTAMYYTELWSTFRFLLKEDFKTLFLKSSFQIRIGIWKDKGHICKWRKPCLEFTIDVYHSSEIRCFCLMKWPGKTLQNLPYFIYTKTQSFFFHFSFHATLFFPL